jgi:hypothetical protein
MKTSKWIVAAAVLAAACLSGDTRTTLAQQALPQRGFQPTRVIEGRPAQTEAQPAPGGQTGTSDVMTNRQQVRTIEPRTEAAARSLPGAQRGGASSSPRATVRVLPPRQPSIPNARWVLGIWFDDSPRGLRINRLMPNSAALRAGLEPGDYLLDIMGYPVGLYNGYYYPLTSTLNQVTPPDGWVNILVWNKRTQAEESMWVRLEPRVGITRDAGY